MRYRKSKIALVIAVALTLPYIVVVNSAAYSTAKEFVQSDHRIRDQLGDVGVVTLNPFLVFKYKEGGVGGHANLALLVKRRSGGTSIVYVVLDKNLGEWSVSSARVKGGQVLTR